MLIRFGQIFYDVEKKIKVKVIGDKFKNSREFLDFDSSESVKVLNLSDKFRDGYSCVKNLQRITDSKDYLYEQIDD